MKFSQFLLFALFFSSCSGGFVEGLLNPAQRSAVDELLRDRQNTELVQPSDCTNPDLEKFKIDNPNYTPYFAEADFNGDGHADFVIATKSAGAYDLWLFLGSAIDYRRPRNFATITWLHDGGFIVRGRMLYVGGFYNDDGTTFAWDGKADRFSVYTEE